MPRPSAWAAWIPAAQISWSDFPWGAVLTATAAATSILLLALVTWLGRYFTPVKETHRIEEEMTERFADLKKAVEKSSDRQEARYATVDQLNGLGARLDKTEERLSEVTTEARSAFNLAQQSSGDVRHLAQRLEDVINKGLDKVERQVEELSRALREGNR